MSTSLLFRAEPYARDCEAVVTASGLEGVMLDRSVFYPQAGGQPGDTGLLRWDGGEMPVANAVKGGAEGEEVLHLPPGPGAPLPPVGTRVTATLDWARRHRHMR